MVEVLVMLLLQPVTVMESAQVKSYQMQSFLFSNYIKEQSQPSHSEGTVITTIISYVSDKWTK